MFLLVRPTKRCLEVGDRDTLTALLSKLFDKNVIEELFVSFLPVCCVTNTEIVSSKTVETHYCCHGKI